MGAGPAQERCPSKEPEDLEVTVKRLSVARLGSVGSVSPNCASGLRWTDSRKPLSLSSLTWCGGYAVSLQDADQYGEEAEGRE